MPIRSSCLAAFILAVAALPAVAQQRAASVLAERVELREITDTTPVLAQLVATTEAEVATRTAGIVADVLFRVGDRVQAGQPLVELDRDLIEIRRRTAAAALEASMAGVAVAEAQLRLAQQAFERTSQLRGSTAFSKGQFDDLEQSAAQAQSELARAGAMVARAEAELARADYDLRHATIRAPFAGVVIGREAQPGSYIDLGEHVATLIDAASLEIEANMPVKFVDALDEGRRLEAHFSDGQPTVAEVRSLLPVETATTRTRPVRLSFEASTLEDTRLAEGKSVTLYVPVSAPRRALTVPKDALVQSRGGWTVFAVEEGAATPRRVEIGGPLGDRMEVVSGLLPGEVVVVRGNERLRPGQPVEARLREPAPVAEPETPPAPSPEADAETDPERSGAAEAAAVPARTREG